MRDLKFFRCIGIKQKAEKLNLPSHIHFLAGAWDTEKHGRREDRLQMSDTALQANPAYALYLRPNFYPLSCIIFRILAGFSMRSKGP